MKPPINTPIYEGELATFWFDESGILCAVAKSTARTVEMQKNNYEFIRQISGNKKVCLLSDTSSVTPPDKAIRENMEDELPKYIKAMAILSQTALGEIIPKLFINLNNQPVPIKFFNDEQSAKDWLKKYL